MSRSTETSCKNNVGEETIFDRSSALTRTLVVCLGLSLLWAVVSGAVVYFFYDDWLAGDLGGLASAGFGALVLLGALLVGMTLESLQAFVNPRPRIVLPSPRLELGSEHSMQLRWTGRTERLRRVRVEVRGREAYSHASPKSGRGVFFQEILLQEEQPVRRERDLHLVLPEDALPSFEEKDHHCGWWITIHGEIPGWADVHAQFPLTVGSKASTW